MPHSPAGRNCKAGQWTSVKASGLIHLVHLLLGGQKQQNGQRVAPSSPLPPDPLHIGSASQAVAFWKHKQPCAATALLASTITFYRTVRRGGRTVPVYTFDMIIHAHTETATSFGAAIFQDSPSAFALHAFTKPVHAHTAADFGLICTLRHPIVLLKKPGHIALGILR